MKWLRRITRWFGRRNERERVSYPVAFWMKDHVVTPIFTILRDPCSTRGSSLMHSDGFNPEMTAALEADAAKILALGGDLDVIKARAKAMRADAALAPTRETSEAFEYAAETLLALVAEVERLRAALANVDAVLNEAERRMARHDGARIVREIRAALASQRSEERVVRESFAVLGCDCIVVFDREADDTRPTIRFCEKH